MADDNTVPTTAVDPPAQGWMSDVQRALAIILIVTFALSVLLAIFRVVWWGQPADVLELAKTMQSALVNMGLIALGFFFGNTVAQRTSSEGQQRILEKLAPSPAPAPVSPSPPVPAWWSELTEDEKTAVTNAGATDPRTQAIVSALTAGSATADDLAYLVSKGLLTQTRADTIKS